MKKEKRGRNKTRKTIDAEYNYSPTTVQCPCKPRAATGLSWSTPPILHTGHGILCCGIFFWSVWVSSPGHDPSQLLVHLLSGRAWDTQKLLIWGNNQHYSHTESKMAPHQWRKLCSSWNQGCIHPLFHTIYIIPGPKWTTLSSSLLAF